MTGPKATVRLYFAGVIYPQKPFIQTGVIAGPILLRRAFVPRFASLTSAFASRHSG